MKALKVAHGEDLSVTIAHFILEINKNKIRLENRIKIPGMPILGFQFCCQYTLKNVSLYKSIDLYLYSICIYVSISLKLYPYLKKI